MKRKVIFFGSHKISLPLLETLLNNELVELSGIVSQTDKPSGRGQKLTPTAVSKFAAKNNIPLLKPSVPDETTIEWMQNIGCDIIIVMAYGHIVKKELIEFPKLGIFNLHASILPKYRGASPIETAIACGEHETGVSLMEIVQEMDAGDVADVEKVTINENDTYAEVAEKISEACPTIINRNIGAICSGTLKLAKQDANNATFTRKLSKSDGTLDFAKSAFEIKCRANAMSPHIGCYIEYEGTTIKIGKVSITGDDCAAFSNGEIIEILPALKIATTNGAFSIHELQKSGGKMLPVKNFINGFSIKKGSIITSKTMTNLEFKK